MSPRRPVTTRSGPRRVAKRAALSGQSDFIELKKLVADIQVRLARLSQGNSESMNFRFRNSLLHTRPNRSPARVEAEALYRLVQLGKNSVNDIRNLITVPPRIEQQAKDMPFTKPDERKTLIAGLEFRKRVLREFESLVARGHSAETAAKAENVELLASAAQR